MKRFISLALVMLFTIQASAINTTYTLIVRDPGVWGDVMNADNLQWVADGQSTGTLIVGGNVNFEGDLVIDNLAIADDATIGGDLGVSGTMTFPLAKGNMLVGNAGGIVSPTSAVFIDSAGKVGIGIVTPTHKLQISGTGGVLDLKSDNGFAWMDFSPDGGTRAWAIGHDAALLTNGFIIYDSLAGKTPFKIYPSSLNNTLVLNTGNVGIGTITPTNILSLGNASAQKIWIENTANTVVGRALTVAAGSTVADGTANHAGGNLILSSGAGKGTGSSSISFFTGTTLGSGSTLQTLSEKMTILGNGNVGIGVAPTLGKLHVVGGIYSDNFRTDETTAHSVFVGDDSGGTGTYSTFVGEHAGEGNTGLRTSGVGYLTLSGNIGLRASAFGYVALQNNTGSDSTANGHSALYGNTGAQSTAVGSSALWGNTGANSTAVGYNALSENTGIANTAVGHQSFNTWTNLTNSSAFGYNAEPTASNQIMLGDLNVTEVKTAGGLTAKWADIVSGATTDSVLHFGEAAGEGGYLTSTGDSMATLSGGAELVSGAWIARSTAASIIQQVGGAISLTSDNSLTDGVAFTPTTRLSINSTTGAATIAGTLVASGGVDSPKNYAVSDEGLVLSLNYNTENMIGTAGAETVFDASGYGNHGTNVTAFTSASGGFNSGGCINTSSTGYTSVVNHASIRPTGAITVSSWFYYNKAGAIPGGAWIVTRGHDIGGANGYMLQIDSGSDLSFVCSTVNAEINAASIGMVGQTWYHVVGTGVASGNTRIYLNGVLKATSGGTLPAAIVQTATENLRVGDAAYSTSPADAKFDDVRVYNRALSANEIKSLYLQRSEMRDSYVSQKRVKVNSSGVVSIPGSLGLASGASVNEFSTDGTMTAPSNVAVPTEQAVVTYVGAQVGSVATLNTAGGTGTGSVALKTQSLTIAGTASEIETVAAGQAVTVGLPDVVKITTALGVGVAPTEQVHLRSTDGSSTILFDLDTADGVIANATPYGEINWQGDDMSSGAAGVRARIAVAASGTQGETAITISAGNRGAGGMKPVFYGEGYGNASTPYVRIPAHVKFGGNLTTPRFSDFDFIDPLGETEVRIISYSNADGTENASDGGWLGIGRARGTEAAPTKTLSGDYLGSISFFGYDTAFSSGAAIRGDASANWGDSATDAPTDLVFLTTPDGTQTQAERMRIKSDGTVQVTTALGVGISPGYKLDVFANATGFVANIFNDGNATTRQVLRLQGGEDTFSTTTKMASVFDGDGTEIGGWQTFAGGLQEYTISDEREKETSTTTTMDVDKTLSEITVIDFNLKGSKEKATGFSAQNLQRAYPDMVSESTFIEEATEENRYDDGYSTRTETVRNDDGTTSTLVKHSVEKTRLYTAPSMLIPLLVKSNQQQQAKIEALEARIEAIEKILREKLL